MVPPAILDGIQGASIVNHDRETLLIIGATRHNKYVSRSAQDCCINTGNPDGHRLLMRGNVEIS
jgi:hypothetical protein